MTRTTRGQSQKGDSMSSLEFNNNEWTYSGSLQEQQSTVHEKRTSTQNAATKRQREDATTSTTTANNTRGASKRGGGDKRNTTSSKNSQQQNDKSLLSANLELVTSLTEAKYEACVDPYRGIVPYFSVSAETGTAENAESMDCPWKNCCHILSNVTGKKTLEEENDKECMVFVQCGCPTVDKWAVYELEAYNKEQLKNAKKKKKKRKGGSGGGGRGRKRKNSVDSDTSSASGKNDDEDCIIVDGDDEVPAENGESNEGKKKGLHLICGERKSDVKTLHPCDYNPHCLASLGGIMDQYRQSVARVLNAKNGKGGKTAILQQVHEDLTSTLNASTQKGGPNGKKGDKNNDLRGTILVDYGPIESHASRYICGNDGGIARHLAQIQDCHRSLMFTPSDSTSVSSGKMELSKPSGLRNLGATCYLNSQLQCLAQNLGFLHGLFSWKKPSLDNSVALTNADKRMSDVLSNMQNILAGIKYGPDRVICTEVFANSLNLENNEMQDPNEFARLLFDRMSESFRRSAEVNLGSEQSNQLANLLPSVFGGTTRYVIECFECCTQSERSEDFMELSVPIANIEMDGEDEAEVGKKRGRGKNGNKSSTGDVDVQQCLNSYLKTESLTGDNKYECSRCKKKCDATRSLELSRIPPVLNIQLARYVFDMETLSKKKLQTKVLLPKSLTIPNSDTKYILCAVQNHLGTSAHGGHYVADVMDWTTGFWYEFNDEEVTILEDGSVASFTPSSAGENGKTKKKGGKNGQVYGSQDAYNLFYVKQSYLASQCKSELQKFTEIEAAPNSESDTGSVIPSMKAQRQKRYVLEMERQTKNNLKSERLRARKEQIVDKLFTPTSQLVNPSDSDSENVWIDTDFLRRFFSCQDDLEELFHDASESGTILKRQSYICEHAKGLHPRVARQGKLLPRSVYDALEAIVQSEYSIYLQHHELVVRSAVSEVTLMDEAFVDGKNLTCQNCGVPYQQETRDKFKLFRTLISIYHGLLPGENDFDQRSVADPSNTYAISRTWSTSLKKYVEKKVNDLKSEPPKKKSDQAKTKHSGAIDDLDLGEVTKKDDAHDESAANSVTDSASEKNQPETLDPFKGEDPTSKISCEHENCPMMHSKSTRLVSSELWKKISRVFPDALAHQYDYKQDDAIGNCKQCFDEKVEGKVFPQKLNAWRSRIAQPPMKDLLSRGKQSNELYPSEVVDLILEQNLQNNLRLRALHKADVQRWRDCCRLVQKSSAKKKSDTVKKQLSDLLFTSSESGREWKFRPLTCDDHNKAVGVPPEQEDIRSWFDHLKESDVELLLDEEYSGLCQTLTELGSLLHGEESIAFPLKPSSAPCVSIDRDDEAATLSITPRLCARGCCVPLFEDECIEDRKVAPKPKQTKRRNTETSELIEIDEAPKGPLCKIVVHETDNETDIEVAASSIVAELSKENSHTSAATGRPRRSRKARGGGVGGFPMHEIEMALDGNLAHFRLLLLQEKGKKLCGQQLILLNTEPSASQESAKELPNGEYNLKSMHELANTDPQSDCTAHMILSYSGTEHSKLKSRRRVSEEEEEEENLLASLTEIACCGWKAADDNDTANGGKKAKRRRQERGFQGTFLQSSDFDEPANASKSEDAPDKLKQNDASETIVIADTPMKIVDAPREHNEDNGDAHAQNVIDEVMTEAAVVDNPKNDLDGDQIKTDDKGKDVQEGTDEEMAEATQGRAARNTAKPNVSDVYRMSDDNSQSLTGAAGPPPAASAARSGSSPQDCLDLTLSDSDDDEDTPPSTSGTNFKGRFDVYGNYGMSLSPRDTATSQKRVQEDANTSKVDTPRGGTTHKRLKKIVTPGSSNSSSSKLKRVKMGEVGYHFHQNFGVSCQDGSRKRNKVFHGEVIQILPREFAREGELGLRDRRCRYNDGDVIELSLEELQDQTTRCKNRYCDMLKELQDPATAKENATSSAAKGSDDLDFSCETNPRREEEELSDDEMSSPSQLKIGYHQESLQAVDKLQEKTSDEEEEEKEPADEQVNGTNAARMAYDTMPRPRDDMSNVGVDEQAELILAGKKDECSDDEDLLSSSDEEVKYDEQKAEDVEQVSGIPADIEDRKKRQNNDCDDDYSRFSLVSSEEDVKKRATGLTGGKPAEESEN